MKRRLIALFTAIMIGLGMLALPMSVGSAEAVIYKPRVSCGTDKGGILLFSGWNGTGVGSWTPACTTTTLGWVKSFRIPAGCQAYKSGIRYWTKRPYPRDVELTGVDYRVTLRLLCR